MNGDSTFAGSIPQIYEQCLVPVLFEPYAADLAARGRAGDVGAGHFGARLNID